MHLLKENLAIMYSHGSSIRKSRRERGEAAAKMLKKS